MSKAIFETRDNQLVPLDDIQHINGRYNDALKDTTIFWSNGNEYALPLDEAKSIINSVEVYASECYDNTQRHLKNAKGLTTIEEMESYDYKIGYPEKLKF